MSSIFIFYSFIVQPNDILLGKYCSEEKLQYLNHTRVWHALTVDSIFDVRLSADLAFNRALTTDTQKGIKFSLIKN